MLAEVGVVHGVSIADGAAGDAAKLRPDGNRLREEPREVAALKPEDQARETIDRQLSAAGWAVQSRDEINLSAGRGVAIREFRRAPGGPRGTGRRCYLGPVHGREA
ncbi:MAG: hypothetical protein D6696_07845 [Acidobacteria bacterium]|nr:MAG: hypothetical protein D6696_07845 [Acidobacteriota bacterium]